MSLVMKEHGHFETLVNETMITLEIHPTTAKKHRHLWTRYLALFKFLLFRLNTWNLSLLSILDEDLSKQREAIGALTRNYLLDVTSSVMIEIKVQPVVEDIVLAFRVFGHACEHCGGHWTTKNLCGKKNCRQSITDAVASWTAAKDAYIQLQVEESAAKTPPIVLTAAMKTAKVASWIASDPSHAKPTITGVASFESMVNQQHQIRAQHYKEIDFSV